MIVGAIQTNIQKRRVVYVKDDLWNYIKQLSIVEGISVSEALRLVLFVIFLGNNNLMEEIKDARKKM